MVVISAPLRSCHVSHHNIYVHVYVCVWGSAADRQPTAETSQRGTSQFTDGVGDAVTHRHTHTALTHTRLASPESTHFSGDCHEDWGLAQTKKTHLVWSARATQITKRAPKLL